MSLTNIISIDKIKEGLQTYWDVKTPFKKQEEAKQNVSKKINITDDIDTYTNFIKKYEGLELTAYKPKHPDGSEEEYYTIGYGRYDKNIKKNMTITEEQADNFLQEDINIRLPEIRKAIPGFDKMPLEVRTNILGSWFRGSIKANHKTVTLINEGKFKEASEEFLNHTGYLEKWKPQKETRLKENKDVSNSVATRMEDTAKAIASLK